MELESPKLNIICEGMGTSKIPGYSVALDTTGGLCCICRNTNNGHDDPRPMIHLDLCCICQTSDWTPARSCSLKSHALSKLVHPVVQVPAHGYNLGMPSPRTWNFRRANVASSPEDTNPLPTTDRPPGKPLGCLRPPYSGPFPSSSTGCPQAVLLLCFPTLGIFDTVFTSQFPCTTSSAGHIPPHAQEKDEFSYSVNLRDEGALSPRGSGHNPVSSPESGMDPSIREGIRFPSASLESCQENHLPVPTACS